MANLRAIKHRIGSAKNVSQITYAMQMVAASKMKKAQVAAISGRPYAEKIAEAVSNFATGINRSLHPLLSVNLTGPTLVVLITTNKGLCGGLNLNLLKTVQKYISSEESQEYVWITIGKKGEAFAMKASGEVIADFSTGSLTNHAASVTKLITDMYLSHSANKVLIAYNKFISALKQEPLVYQLLPVVYPATAVKTTEFIIEPNKEALFDQLLYAYIENLTRDALRQAEASEYSARMVTMKAATDAAKDFISLLTLEYNKARQEKVTTEISDIVTARLSVS